MSSNSSSNGAKGAPPATTKTTSTKRNSVKPKSHSTKSTCSIGSTGFDAQSCAHNKSLESLAITTHSSPPSSLTFTEVKSTPLFDVYCTPIYESNSDTSSLRKLYHEAQFIKLTTAAVGSDASHHQDGAIVGVLVLFHRQELKLLESRVLLRNDALGVLTTAAALGQFGLKMKPPVDKETAEQTIATLTSEAHAGQSCSPLLVKLVLFDEKLCSSLQAGHYPFPMRSSEEAFTIPELMIRPTNKGR